MQPGTKPLPKEVVTENSMRGFVWEQTQVRPTKISLMNDIDSIVEFDPDVDVFEIAKKLHRVKTWGEYQIEMGHTCPQTGQVGKLIGGQKQEGEDPLQVQRQQQLLEEEWLCRDEIQGLIHSFESKLRQFETNALQIVETPMLSLLVVISQRK